MAEILVFFIGTNYGNINLEPFEYLNYANLYATPFVVSRGTRYTASHLAIIGVHDTACTAHIYAASGTIYLFGVDSSGNKIQIHSSGTAQETGGKSISAGQYEYLSIEVSGGQMYGTWQID